MNEPENNLQSSSGLADVNEKYEDLRRQFNVLFIGLVITSFTLTAFLGLQAKRMAGDLGAVKPRAEEAGKMVQQEDANIAGLFSRLQEFARTHPDFQNKVLYRYSVSTNNAAAAAMRK